MSANTMRVGAVLLAMWVGFEGFAPKPEIPTRGDVPTIGYGSTHYEDGRKVTMQDPPITRARAGELAMNLLESTYGQCVKRNLGEALVNKAEFDMAVDFAGQYGCFRYSESSILKKTLAGDYAGACKAYLLYKFAAGYDCSQWINGAPNRRCYGVWTRQQARSAACEGAL